jgi:hypothetical protein
MQSAYPEGMMVRIARFLSTVNKTRKQSSLPKASLFMNVPFFTDHVHPDRSDTIVCEESSCFVKATWF